MPGKQAKVVTPPDAESGCCGSRLTHALPCPRSRDDPPVSQGGTARLRDGRARMVDGPRRARQGRRRSRDPRRDCQEARRPAHPHASRPSPRASKLVADKRTLWAPPPLRPWRLFAPDQRGQLVCGAVQRARLRGMLVALRPDEPSSPPPRATSTAAAAACATFSCSRDIDPSRRPSATSTAIPAGKDGWSACCEAVAVPTPDVENERHPGHAPLRTLDYSPLSRQRAEVEPLRATSVRRSGTLHLDREPLAPIGSA